MGNKYLAIDIGETQGHHILGYMEEGKLRLEEIHSFKNVSAEKDGKRTWDFESVFTEIKAGIIKCREMGKLPIFVGLTACEEDFVLLDHENNITGDMNFCRNTIGQMKAISEEHPDYLDKAECFQMLPDYFNFLLTGMKKCEYTNLLPTKLLSWDTKEWDDERITAYGFPRRLFPAVSQPGSVIGNLTREVTEAVGYDCIIIQPASRKAGMAILKSPGEEYCCNITEEWKAAVGNLMVLMICSHELKDFHAARECIKNSF